MTRPFDNTRSTCAASALEFTQLAYEAHGTGHVIRFAWPELQNGIGPVAHDEPIHAGSRFRDGGQALVAVVNGAAAADCLPAHAMRDWTRFAPGRLPPRTRGAWR